MQGNDGFPGTTPLHPVPEPQRQTSLMYGRTFLAGAQGSGLPSCTTRQSPQFLKGTRRS